MQLCVFFFFTDSDNKINLLNVFYKPDTNYIKHFI